MRKVLVTGGRGIGSSALVAAACQAGLALGMRLQDAPSLTAVNEVVYTPPKPRSPWDRGTGAGPGDGLRSMMERLGAKPK